MALSGEGPVRRMSSTKGKACKVDDGSCDKYATAVDPYDTDEETRQERAAAKKRKVADVAGAALQFSLDKVSNQKFHGNEFIGDDLVTVVNLVNFSKKAVRRSIERGDPAEDLVTVQNIRAIAGILMKRAKASIVRDDYILRNDELRLARECFDSSSSSSNRGPANEAGAGAKRENKKKETNETDGRASSSKEAWKAPKEKDK